MKTITVTGVGRASCPADFAEICFTVRRVNEDCGKAVSEVNERAQALTAAYRSLFPKSKLVTASFDVSVEYAETEEGGLRRRKAVGYACRQTFRLGVAYSQENLAAAIGALGETEAELSLRFTVRDPERLRKKLLEAACKDAAEKAKILAGACGGKAGEIAEIRYGTSVGVQPSPLRIGERAVAAFASVRAEIVPDEIRAEECVEIVYRLD